MEKFKFVYNGRIFDSKHKCCEFYGICYRSVMSYQNRHKCTTEESITHFIELKKSKEIIFRNRKWNSIKTCCEFYDLNESPHLFLITETEQGILLSSYEIPEGEDKKVFSYASMKKVDYAELKKSEKFTPALYHEKDGIWEGGSISQFSPVMIFKLWEKFSDRCLEVSESMEVNGKRTFGYDEPIIYKRV